MRRRHLRWQSAFFSPVGTSDPVREMRDGSMLHIMRHYRPEKVYIFLSKEMEDFEKADHRLEKTFCFVNEKWADDTVEAVYEYSGLFQCCGYGCGGRSAVCFL